MVINLIGNALKFTEYGSITVKASLKEPLLIKVTVVDTGIGIKAEYLKNLFQAFGRIDLGQRQASLNPQGVGLGLAISNILAQNLSS